MKGANMPATAEWRYRGVVKGPEMPPGTKCYQRDLPDGHLTVLVSRENGHWHLSISHRVKDPETGKPAPGRIPTWEEIKAARYAFCPDGCATPAGGAGEGGRVRS